MNVRSVPRYPEVREDGSMWGRYAGGSITGKRDVIRPRFLRHGRGGKSGQGQREDECLAHNQSAFFTYSRA